MSSTPEDWAKTALSLFNNRRYMQAMHCYERAGLSRERAVANAYYLREGARTKPIDRRGSSSSTSAFLAAANAFVDSAKRAITEKNAYYRIAAQCYVDAGLDSEAAWAYVQAMEYTLAAQHYRKAGEFEKAVELIKSHGPKMQAEVVESIVDVSKLYFLREKQIGYGHNVFGCAALNRMYYRSAMDLFQSDEEALEYMDDYGLDLARAQLLEDLGRFSEAADVLLSEGSTLEAIRVLTRDSGNKDSLMRALQCLLDGLWRNLSCGVPVDSTTLASDGMVNKLLLCANALEDAFAGDEQLTDEVCRLRQLHAQLLLLMDVFEISMFRAIAKHDMQELLVLSNRFASRSNHSAAFICLDRIFSAPLKLQTATQSHIINALQTFYLYACMLQKFCSVRSPCDDPIVRRLFALEPFTADLFLLPKGALLAATSNRNLIPSAREVENGLLVNRWELEKLLKDVLKLRLLSRVNEEDKMCSGLPALQPCLSHAIYGHCNRMGCPFDHIDSERYDVPAYNTRIRLHILQILIYQTLYYTENPREHAQRRRSDFFSEHVLVEMLIVRPTRYWLRRLYEALCPPYYKLGSLQNLSPPLIPEFSVGTHVIKAWVCDLLYFINPWFQSNTFMTNFMQGFRLAFRFDASAASDYVHRIRSVASDRPPVLMRSGDTEGYIVHYFMGSMTDGDSKGLNKGVLFMKFVISPIVDMCNSLVFADSHLLENEIPIDLGVLCDFMDHLCGSLLIASRLKAKGDLHDMTLPKSWLLRLSPSIRVLCTKDTELVKIYKKQISSLLEPLYTGQGAGKGH